MNPFNLNPLKTPYNISFLRILKYAVAISILIVFLVLTILYAPRPFEVKYDCNIVEITPDYPKWIKEECRKKSRNRT